MSGHFRKDKAPIQGKPRRGRTRRSFLNDVLNAVMFAGLTTATMYLGENSEEHALGENARTYDTGRLAGQRAGDLFAAYMGLPDRSRIPERVRIDFSDVLDSLWERKYQQASDPGVRANIQRTGERLKREYRDDLKHNRHEPVTIAEFAAQSEEIVSKLKRTIRWNELNTLPEFASLSVQDSRLVHSIAEKVTGKMMFAYAITELMPSLNHSAMNVDMAEFLLGAAGKKFLSRLPAVHDDMLSFGFFQFTSFALYDVPGERRGASVINALVSDASERISGSVATNEEAGEQMRAAYLLAVENIALLVREIRQGDASKARARMQTLRENADAMGQVGTQQNYGLMQLLASTHHFPAPARTGFISWVDHNFQGSHAERCRGRIVDYIKKSQGNYRELLRRLPG